MSIGKSAKTCRKCGARVRGDNESGYCLRHRDQHKTYTPRPSKGLKCRVCSKGLFNNNKSGFCGAHKRDEKLHTKYGITTVEFNALLTAQGGCCAICKGTTPGGQGEWHVDHDHASGKVRGLLCAPCNLSLGGFKDSPDLLRAALAYLLSHLSQRAA